ncbi:unnamed protein product [Cylindrotheca closterium]|uniref:tRNA-specific adenosine deaminase 1 n=1 Tax=Cylindrotheca closterium TaxID=2856 RepID=A0AAD2FN73_9STRA|nr:unnamed protein product [Cylindrotheca closterium]
MSSKIAESVAECALSHYNKNISKGKPKDQSEFTVYASIVAQQEDNFWVVSAATGTKCTAIRKQGFVLHDSHAEILARRGLVRVLWLQINAISKSQSFSKGRLLLEQEPCKEKYKIRQDIALHLYVSDSPCGDASIYGASSGFFFTGAKIIVSKETGVTSTVCGGDTQLLQGAPIARENSQLLSSLRCKSGRSNLPSHLRSTSMSCSDKIVKWSILGLQGSLLSNLFKEPVLLSSIVVSQDTRIIPDTNHQLEALERAIPSRARAVWNYVAKTHDTSSKWQWKDHIPSVHVVRSAFSSGKSALATTLGTPFTSRDEPSRPPPYKKTKLSSEASPNRKVSPCGFAMNWQCTDPNVPEILIGARGIRQGKKPSGKKLEEYQKLSSRLSRQSLLQRCTVIFSTDITQYQALKSNESDSNWKLLKTVILDGGPLSGWLREQDDFPLHLTSEQG